MDKNYQFKSNFDHDCYKWNLTDDVRLLKHLEKLSEGFLSNVAHIKKCLDGLDENLTLTYLNVRSVSNVFHSVGDSHFVENRVHDEDETKNIAPIKMDFLQYPDDPQSLNEKLHQSLATCLHILEEKFETVQLSESDSDDEGLEHSQLVLKPRQNYAERYLPHIIGSNKFLNDSSLGLSLRLQEQIENIEVDENEFGIIRNSPQEPLTLFQDNENENLLTDVVDRGSRSQQLNPSSMLSHEGLMRDSINEITNLHIEGEESANENKSVTCIEVNTEAQIIEKSEKKESISGFENRKPYSKDVLKSRLEHIFSFPHQGNVLIKKNTNLQKNSVDEVMINTDSQDTYDSNTLFHSSSVLATTSSYEPKPGDSKSSGTLINSSLEGSSDPLDLFPNIPTKKLHCLAKSRAKNTNKRRLPSRRRRDVHSQASNLDSNFLCEPAVDNLYKRPEKISTEPKQTSLIRQEPSLNNLLSPVTDEEDLFTISSPFDSPSDPSDPTINLFQPITSANASQTLTADPMASQASINFQWDPFTEDSTSLFNTLSKNDNKKNLSNENLFSSIHSETSLFSPSGKLKTNDASSNSNLFGDLEDDSLFCSSTINTNFVDAIDVKGDTSEESSRKISKAKKNFLSDPLSFNDDE